MPNEELSSQASGGGAATAAGMDFQHRVAAWLAVRILSEADVDPIWSYPSSSTLEFIRCETEQPVDDIMVGISDRGLALLQVKHSLSMERTAGSAFGKSVDQFVRQMLRPGGPNPHPDKPWERAIDFIRDRLVLVVGRTASLTITSVLPTVLKKIRLLSENASLSDSTDNQAEKEALGVTSNHIETAWRALSAKSPCERQIRELLSLIYVQVLDVDPGGTEEREAKDTLRRVVLLRPSEADVAWVTLIEECTRLATLHSGGDRHHLRTILDRAGIGIRAPRSYQNDIQKLAAYSLDTIKSLASFATISIGRNNPLKIDRPSTRALRAAAESNSILVTGEPGSGKSGALYDLAVALQNDNHDVFFIAADRVESSSLNSLKQELALDHSLVEVLENWYGNGPAYLITDALDAARSEYGGRMLHELIERTLLLRGRWRVVASIRKFDLRYNRRLRALFPAGQPEQHQDPEFADTRHFSVPRLSPEELYEVGTQSESMRVLIDAVNTGTNKEIQELLRIPFNLRLLGELIGEGLAVHQLTPIRTQLELLDRYWQERVIRADHYGDLREGVLRRAVSKMVGNRVLRVARIDITEDSVSGPILADLLSADLLQEHQVPMSPPDRYTLTFAHHLLFDYAVARLLFRTDPPRLVAEIASDPERVVAFRPSLALHFRHEWEMEVVYRSRFWNLVFRFNEAPEIPLIGKIIGPTEAVELVEKIQDLKALLVRVTEESEFGANNRHGRDALRHFVGALMTRGSSTDQLAGPNAKPWCEFAAALSKSVAVVAYPLAQLTTLLSERFGSLTPEQRTFVNTAARSLLDHAWSNDKNYDPALVRSGLVGVCRTFGADGAASSALLRAALSTEHARRYGHEEFFHLAQEVPQLVPNDPNLVRDLYKTVFKEYQSSEATTFLGGRSQIMPLLSTVGQDWRGIFYVMTQAYPAFLNSEPIAATQAVVAVIAAWVAREHAPASGEVIEHHFEFAEVECAIRTDYSAIWDSGSASRMEEAIQMLNAFQEYIERIGSAEEQLLHQVLTSIAVENVQAVIWRRLLWAGVERPKPLGLCLRKLLWQVAILTSLDTTEPAAALIKVIFESLTTEERGRIEQTMLAIPPHVSEDGRTDYRMRDRLLGSLPLHLIVTPEVADIRDRLDAEGGPPQNVPLFQISESEWVQYTPQEYLRGQGVPVEDPVNRRLIELVEPIKKFCALHLNDAPSREQTAEIYPRLSETNDTIRTAEADGVHPSQQEYALRYLVQACARIASRLNLTKGEPALELVHDILLEVGGKTQSEEVLETSDSFDRAPSWGSPAPLVDAANGLMFLGSQPASWETRVSEAVLRLSRNTDPAVRLQIAGNLHLLERTDPEQMWALIAFIAEQEPSRAVLQAGVASLSNLAGRHPEKVVPLVECIFDRITDGEESKGVRSTCFNIFLGLYLWRGLPASERRILKLIDAPWEDPDVALHLAHSIRDDLTRGPSNPTDLQQESVRQRALGIVDRMLESTTRELKRLGEEFSGRAADVPPGIQARGKIIHQCIDAIAHQIFFASGAFDLQHNQSDEALNREQRKRFLKESESILDKLASTGISNVAYHLAGTLESLLEFDPEGVFLRLHHVIVSAKSGGFEFESLAAQLVVRVVKLFLAEYRDLLRDSGECRAALVEILDTFVGWPAAQRLTYDLEEIFR